MALTPLMRHSQKRRIKVIWRNICDTRSLFEVSTQSHHFDVALQLERYSFTVYIRDPRWLYYFLRFFLWFVSPLTWRRGLSSRLIRSLVGCYFTFDNYSSSIARSHWTSLLALIGETIFQAAKYYITRCARQEKNNRKESQAKRNCRVKKLLIHLGTATPSSINYSTEKSVYMVTGWRPHVNDVVNDR